MDAAAARPTTSDSVANKGTSPRWNAPHENGLTIASAIGMTTLAIPQVIFTEPRADEAQCAPPSQRTATESCRPLRILMVETTNVTSLAPELALRKTGNAVWVAYQVDEALDFLHEADFDVVIIDIAPAPQVAMKLAAALRLNEFRWSRSTPILGLVDTPWDADGEQILEAGFDGFISGRLKPETFVQEVKAALVCAEIEPVTDAAALLQKAGGDLAFLQELVQIFEEQMQVDRVAIADAINEGNYPGVRFAAHRLKGMVANFTESSVIGLLQQLETAAGKGEGAGLVRLLRPIHDQLLSLSRELRMVVDGGPGGRS